MVCSVAKLDRAFRLVDACVFDWHDPPRRAGVLRTPRQGGGKSRAGHPRMGFGLRFIDPPRKSRVFFFLTGAGRTRKKRIPEMISILEWFFETHAE